MKRCLGFRGPYHWHLGSSCLWVPVSLAASHLSSGSSCPCQVPQLVENYRSRSADGVSLLFLAVWFVGDLANFFGAVWAGLVPTVIALAIYFLVADSVLISQCLYYNLINSRKSERRKSISCNQSDPDNAEQPLLGRTPSNSIGLPGSRRPSTTSHTYDGPHSSSSLPPAFTIWVRNTICVSLVCFLGLAGWAIAWKAGLWTSESQKPNEERTHHVVGAEVLGYTSAVCYLGLVAVTLPLPLLMCPENHSARIPQIFKNYRERSCEGTRFYYFKLPVASPIYFAYSTQVYPYYSSFYLFSATYHTVVE